MAGYGGISKISDEQTRNTLKYALDLIKQLQTQVRALETNAVTKGTTIDAAGRKIVNLAAPTAGSDAVTLDHLRAVVDAVKKATY